MTRAPRRCYINHRGNDTFAGVVSTRERERDASACVRRHQAFALPPWASYHQKTYSEKGVVSVYSKQTWWRNIGGVKNSDLSEMSTNDTRRRSPPRWPRCSAALCVSHGHPNAPWYGYTRERRFRVYEEAPGFRVGPRTVTRIMAEIKDRGHATHS